MISIAGDMLNLLLFCTALTVAYYLVCSYRRDCASAVVAQQRVWRRRQQEQQRRAQRTVQLGRAVGVASASFYTIGDIYRSHAQLMRALRQVGLHQIVPIVGVDFSASNRWQGRRSTWHRQGLHRLATESSGSAGGGGRDCLNSYQHAIRCVGRALSPFMRPSQQSREDMCRTNVRRTTSEMYAFGFGDAETRNTSLFSLSAHCTNRMTFRTSGWPAAGAENLQVDAGVCANFEQLEQCYRRAVQQRTPSGPTCLAPLVDRVVSIISNRPPSVGQLHLLVVLTDGQLPEPQPSAAALVRASSTPLSVALVGIGDGPWDTLQAFDDFLPARRFDNVQFVPFDEILSRHSAAKADNVTTITTGSSSERNVENIEMAFALELLMEVPEQFRLLCNLGLARGSGSSTVSNKHDSKVSKRLGNRSRSTSPKNISSGCWPKTFRIDKPMSRFIPGDPSPLLRRKLFSSKKRQPPKPLTYVE